MIAELEGGKLYEHDMQAPWYCADNSQLNRRAIKDWVLFFGRNEESFEAFDEAIELDLKLVRLKLLTNFGEK